MAEVYPPSWTSSCEMPETAFTDHLAIDYFPKAGRLELSILQRDPEVPRWYRGARVILTHTELQRCPGALQLLRKAVLELGREV